MKSDKITEEQLEILGARVHNLKNIDLNIPRNKLVVVTGISGSGKSSLAFDTIYAEGQRRYMETFSAYARHFIGNLDRPDVDKISGLSPVISIEQKSTNKNPRSTVGTITEIYDFIRLLYARTSEAYSYVTGEKMVRYTEEKILETIIENYRNKNIILLSQAVKGRKGHYRDLFEQIRKKGFLKVCVDGEIRDITPRMQLDRYKVHDIEIVIDNINVKEESRKRITESVRTALKHGKGVIVIKDTESGKSRHLSHMLMCPTSGISYNEPEPNTFSFNSPYGSCPKCNGLGRISEIDLRKIFPDKNLSIKNGGIAPIGNYKNNWIFRQMEAIGQKFDFTLDTPIKNISDQAINIILYGTEDVLHVNNDYLGVSTSYSLNFEGIANFILNQHADSTSKSINKWVGSFMNKISCPECNGSRLKKESLYFKVAGKDISELAQMDLIKLNEWFKNLERSLDERQVKIAHEVIREISNRIRFLLDVGLDYITLNRPARSLSGGESQRIRLATQIGSQLVGVLYILDEPSIGLHQRDNLRLIKALKDLRDIGNSVIVVEHDKEMILSSDYVVELFIC